MSRTSSKPELPNNQTKTINFHSNEHLKKGTFMKAQTIIPLLSVMLTVSLAAQDNPGTPAPVAAMQRATQTIADADQTYTERESEVLAADEEPTVEVSLPDLPDEPSFEVPEEEVFLDLPGSSTESSAIAVDAETISVDFPEEDVRDIIRSVAELYELNVVIPDGLTGSVSIKLRDVTWQQVFSVVLEPMGYTYIMEGNIIKIKSQDELAVEPVDTRVFIVDFAKAGDLRASVEPLINPAAGGKIQVDSRSNALVITERPSRMNDIQEIIEILDRPTEQVMIESKFVEITGEIDNSIGINWQSLAGYNVNLGPMQREYFAESGRNAKDGKTTKPYRTRTDTDSFDISNNSGQTSTDIAQGTSTQVIDELYRSETRLDTAVFSADAFSMVLSALEQNTDIELVSNPTLVTMNNSPAQINIGEEFPIPNYTYNQERGTFEVSDFEWKNIGINLNVTPQINSAGFINLQIQPEISSRSGEVVFGGASGAVIPIITTRKTMSNVTIKSGYTLAIGGLIEQRMENLDTKVPLLGDIPGLGRLFRSKSKMADERNLIVFITAKILSASGATYRDVVSQEKLLRMGINESDLPGYEPSANEKELYDAIEQKKNDLNSMEKQIQLKEKLRQLDNLQRQNNQDLMETGVPEDEQPVIRRRFQ